MDRVGRCLAFAAVLAVAAGTAAATTAKQYRGPVNELPKAVALPGQGDLYGLSRLESASGNVEGYNRWEFWWEMNRDRLLRAVLRRNSLSVSGDSSPAHWGPHAQRTRPVSSSDVRDRILPVLLSRLASPDPEERAIAALSLGKARIERAFFPLKALLAGGSRSDREAAALSLGFLGERFAVPLLRDYVDRKSLSAEERCYGLLALGFLGGDEAASTLRQALRGSLKARGPQATEFQATAATALGLCGGRKALAVLVPIAAGRKGVRSKVRASALVALGKIGDQAALATALTALAKGPIDVRRAAAQAIGLLRSPQAIDPLALAYQKDPDIQVRGLAAISLAEIGGTQAGDILERGLSVRTSRAVRGFSALALGLLGDVRRAPVLRKILSLPSETSFVGAAAIGLGLLGDSNAIAPLRKIALDPSRNDALRGYALLALAMLKDPLIVDRLETLAQAKGRSDLRREATLATGLEPGSRTSRQLVDQLVEERDPFVRGAAVAALELSPTHESVSPLVRLASTRSVSADVRKDALTCLGALAMRGRASALARLVDNLDYRSMSRATAAASVIL